MAVAARKEKIRNGITYKSRRRVEGEGFAGLGAGRHTSSQRAKRLTAVQSKEDYNRPQARWRGVFG
jgi:hypothetical protein